MIGSDGGGRDVGVAEGDGASSILVGGGGNTHLRRGLPCICPIFFNKEENWIPSAHNDTSTVKINNHAEQYDEEYHLSGPSSPQIVMTNSACRHTFAFDIYEHKTSITDLQHFAGRYLIRVRNDPCHGISQGHAMIDRNNSNNPALEDCFQARETFAYWSGGISFAAMIAIICAIYTLPSAKDKGAPMTVGVVGCAGIFLLSLLLMASRLCRSAHPLLEVSLKFIVSIIILLFALVTFSLLCVIIS